jgi:hypothetical protein
MNLRKILVPTAVLLTIILPMVSRALTFNGQTEKPAAFGLKIVNHEELFKVINEALKTQTSVEIETRAFFEFQGIMAEVIFCDPTEMLEKPLGDVEPTQRPYKYPISGTVRPGRYRFHGPYGAAISIEIDVSWMPTDQACVVGIIGTQTGEGPAEWLYGGSGQIGWSTDPNTSYYVIVASPQPPNTKTITYNGQVTVWRPT